MGNQTSRADMYASYMQNPQQVAPPPSAVDPYEVLGVRKNFSWEELKDAYRRTAKLVHPDKGGSEVLFNLVTECFRQLGEEYKFRMGGRPHHELKAESLAATESRQSAAARPPATAVAADENFLDRFNKIFDENKFTDEEADSGYGDMMEKSTGKREDINIPRTLNKFNREKFNSLYDKATPVSKEVIVYHEPEPLSLAKKIQFTELGITRPDDYSSALEIGEKRGLQYTDYMKAHTTSRLVDPRAVQERREFRNVEEYEAYRQNHTKRTLTEKEIARRRAEEEANAEREAERIRRVKQRDEAVEAHHKRMNQLMLGV